MLSPWSIDLSQFFDSKLSLIPEEAILGVEVMIMDLKPLFPAKTEALACCIELALGMTIFSVAAWSIAYIKQPNDTFSHKCSNFPGISVHPHCPGP